MMSGKWYYCYNSAEGVDTFVAFLTDEEVKTVQKFLAFQHSDKVEQDYGGTCYIELPGYNTREAAVEAARR